MRRARRLRNAGAVVFGLTMLFGFALTMSWLDSWWWAHTLVPGTLAALGMLTLGCVLTVAGERIERREREWER